MREYHALRVNLTPQDVDMLEDNHKNLTKYIATLKNQLSEGRMAVATATVEGHGEPVHPSISGTVTGYVNGVLQTVKNDTSLDKVEHPWTKKKAHGAYAVAQAAAEEEARVLANIASTRAGGSKTAPKESRRKRRRRQNAASSRKQQEMLNSHDTSDGLPKTDLQQTFRDVHRNRSMLQDATVSFQAGKKSYSEPLVRPSTAPPPKSPFGALKLLQHVLTYDMYEYKRAPPREIGPGHYDLSAAIPPTIKDPARQSASFLSPHARGNEAQQNRQQQSEEDNDSSKDSGSFGAPTTFSGRQRMIAKILIDQGIHNASDKDETMMSPYDRMTKGLRSPKRSPKRRLPRNASLLGGSQSEPILAPPQPSIGSNLWDDSFYQLPSNDSKNDKRRKQSGRLSPILQAAEKNSGVVPFDKQDLFYRPTSPEFKFPSSIRFKQSNEPHWKGLGSPFNMEKDLKCWLQQKVYVDQHLPRDGGAWKRLENREEGPRNLDQSFNSMVKNLKSSPITYKPSFDKRLPRFASDGAKAGSDYMPDPNTTLKWEQYQGSLASDLSRPSLSFVESGHPEDASVIITMGSQFDKQKPRFLPATTLRKQLAALELELKGSELSEDGSLGRGGGGNGSGSGNGNGSGTRNGSKLLSPKGPPSKKKTKGTATGIRKRRSSKSRMSPTINRTSPTGNKRNNNRMTVRPSTSVVQGASSLGKMASTV